MYCVTFLRIKNHDEHFEHLMSEERQRLQSLVDLSSSGRRGSNFAFEIRERFADFLCLITIISFQLYLTSVCRLKIRNDARPNVCCYSPKINGCTVNNL